MSYWAPNQTMLDYGVPNTEEFGSVCDGDSGAGFFVEKGDTRYYLGAVGGQQGGIPNCQTATWAIFGVGGGMSGFTPTFKFLPLLKEAESIVAEEKLKEAKKIEEERLAAELQAKQEAEQRAAAEAQAAAELKAKQDAEAKAAQELAASKAAAQKKTTITCVKGKLTKKVTAIKPKCPAGYKKR
jgi:hypothetical protein